MEVMFIEANSKKELSERFIDKVYENVKGKSVGLSTTVQYIKQVEVLEKKLLEKGVKVTRKKSPLGVYPSQILGCSVPKYETDIVLYLGCGKFHPIGLALENKREVLIANPETEEVFFQDMKEVDKYERKVITNKTLVKNAKVMGLLVSNKEGQNRLDTAIKLKKRLEEENKKAYILLFDTLDFNSLENYSWIEAYINTACPRIFDDNEKFNKPMINIYDYEK